MKVKITRLIDNKVQTEGVLYVIEDNQIIFSCYTIELPWIGNQKKISCIPAGTYNVIKHNSPKFNKSFWIQDVENRDGILIHQGNYHTQILGCILVGDNLTDMNNDGYVDVTNSVKTIEKMYDLLSDSFELEINYRT